MVHDKTGYEWVAEHIDEFGDIQDLWHVDKLTAHFVSQSPVDGCVEVHIGLVRQRYNEYDGITEQKYWYPKYGGSNFDGPTEFTNPPKRFLAEAKKFGLLD